MIVVLIFITFIAIVILLWQISNFISVFFGSPYVMANKKVVIKALKAANLKKGDIFYDLGAGNGDVLREAEKFGAKSIGYEISPYYYILAKLRTLNKPSIQVKYQNINNVSLKKADIVYCYLLPNFLEKLSLKFQKELKLGCRIISIGFPINKLQNSKEIRINNHNIYLYVIK